jgi:8-oxo-dGTP pyrophosphatase MutT (NUDIX family)
MSLPSGVTAKPNRMRPRDAATLVIIDRSGPAPRILMGRRRADLAFMPNKFVFPGGRVDPRDGSAPSLNELQDRETEKLMLGMLGRPSTRRARALAITAVRETREETGIVIGSCDADSYTARAFLPQLNGLTYFARAITPPGRPRRYDTRFFSVDAGAISAQGEACDDELSGVDWFTLSAINTLDLPGITRRIISDVAHLIEQNETSAPGYVPFYHMRFGKLRRDRLGSSTLYGSVMATS